MTRGKHLASVTHVIALLAAACVSTYLLLGPTLEYGFFYDDYAFVRPHSAPEVVASFTGTWDRSGIMAPFYRPLTVALHAVAFELFGLNSEAHHAASLILFALAGTLTGAFVFLACRSVPAALLGVLVFVAHPAMPYAQAVWVTNQMHVAESVVVLGALVWWYGVAARRTIWWLPLLPCATAAFMIKEDGAMLLPAILVLHWLRRRLFAQALPPAPRAFVISAAVLLGALMFLRSEALGGLGGYGGGMPTIERGWRNYTWGLSRVFRLIPPDRPWQPAASWFATLVPPAALFVWRRAPQDARFLIAGGAAIALIFDAPFVFVTKIEQLHLVALGAVLVLTASIRALVMATPAPARAVTGAVLLLWGMPSFVMVSRDVSTDFAPFGMVVLSRDKIVREWAAVSEELREYLARKMEPSAAASLSPNPVEAVGLAAFGLHPSETSAEGIRYRWMSQPWAELHLPPAGRSVTIPLRHDAGAFREPTEVRIHSDGRLVDVLALTDTTWRASRFGLRPDAIPLFVRMHRVRITIPHAWVPSQLYPGTTDHRTLGLQIGVVDLR